MIDFRTTQYLMIRPMIWKINLSLETEE